jgi:hypothetical protein
MVFGSQAGFNAMNNYFIFGIFIVEHFKSKQLFQFFQGQLVARGLILVYKAFSFSFNIRYSVNRKYFVF